MKTIKLHGWLGKQFGRSFEMDVKTPAEALRALCAQLTGFQQALADDTTGFKLFAAKENFGVAEFHYPFSDREVLHVVPAVAGAQEGGKSGGMQILIGIVIIVAMFYTAGAASTLMGGGMMAELAIGAVYAFGAAMVISGVATMLFAPPVPSSTEKPENRPSYNFNGAVNTVQQGGAVPILYGELICGSQVVSAGLSVEDTASSAAAIGVGNAFRNWIQA